MSIANLLPVAAGTWLKLRAPAFDALGVVMTGQLDDASTEVSLTDLEDA